uniref:Elongin-A n=1 Tax=Leersia perrieri TaxID=77586 RepID=A0A0D9X4T5_9ORYZ
MEYRRKPPSLLELCIRTTMDNLRYVQSVDGVEMNLLERILPHCKLEDLTRIEDNTEMDLSPITDKMWKLFYRQQFGEDSVNLVIKRMSTSGVRYKWRNLFEAKTEKQKEFADKMGQRLAKKYEAAKAGSGPSNLSSYKSPILKKARMEVNSDAKMKAAIQRNTISTSQHIRMNSGYAQPVRTTTVHRPNSTITITRPLQSNKPTGLNRSFQSDKPTGPNRPFQSDKPTGPNRPLPSNKPTGLNRPLPSNKPTGPNRPLQSNKSTGTNRPLPSNKPTGLNKPLQSDKTTGLNRPFQSDKPTGMNRPFQSNRPKS